MTHPIKADLARMQDQAMNFTIHIPIGPVEYVLLGIVIGAVIGAGWFFWLIKDVAFWR